MDLTTSPDRKLGYADARVLADMVSKLRKDIEAVLGEGKVTTAAVSTPTHLNISHQQVTAVLEHVSIRNIMHVVQERAGVSHNIVGATAAYAGHGMGLCKDWLSAIECEAQESCLPRHNLLHLDLSETSLSASILPDLQAWYRHEVHSSFVDNTLGTNELADYQFSQQRYRKAVRRSIQEFVRSSEINITATVLTGTSASNPIFRSLVRGALEELMPKTVTNILRGFSHDQLSSDSMWVTARGAAELAKRLQEGPFLCPFGCTALDEDELKAILDDSYGWSYNSSSHQPL